MFRTAIIHVTVSVLNQWLCSQGVGFLIQGYCIQNHWMAPRSTEHFHFSMSINSVAKNPGRLLFNRKLSYRIDSADFRMYPKELVQTHDSN